MIHLGQRVSLKDGFGTLGEVIALHGNTKATIRTTGGGTILVPVHLLTPTERPPTVANKSAPRRPD